jgi:hypothetical protein
LGNVVATVSYNDVVLYTSKSIASGFRLIEGLDYGAGEDNVSIAVGPSALAVQLGLYQIQPVDSFTQATLTLSVVADHGGPFTASANLAVVAEAFDASWWAWSPDQNVADIQPFSQAGSSTFDWNTPYSLSGNFVNKSKWSAMKVQIFLAETDLQTNSQVLRSAQTLTADMGPNPNFVIFPSITQNWAWLTCPSGVRGAPTFKYFNYVVIISMQDPWGNNYPGLTVGPYGVIVGIPVSKLQNSTSASAAWLFAMACLASVLGAPGAAFAMPIAAALCGKAQDPPTPDFDYHSTAKIQVYEPPPPSGETTHIRATMSFLSLLLKLIAIISALDQTEGKLIAARQDNDSKGVSLQTKTWRHFEETLTATAQEVRSAVPHVVRELEDAPSMSAENVRAAVRSLQMYGISASFEKAIRETGCSCRTLQSLEESIRAVDPTKLPSCADLIISLTRGLLVSVGYIRKEADSIMTTQQRHIGVTKKRPSRKSK